MRAFVINCSWVTLVFTMYRKKLFLESVHKLGLAPEKENTVISLFEATHGQLTDEEFNPEFDENPSDMQDAISGEIDDTPDGSALEEPSNEKDDKKQQIKRMVEQLNRMLEPFRMANVHQHHLPNTPNQTYILINLGYLMDTPDLAQAYDDMRQDIQNMSWEVIQFNKAESPSEAWKLQFNPGAAQTKKFNAITMIRQYMQRIDRNLESIKETLGII